MLWKERFAQQMTHTNCDGVRLQYMKGGVSFVLETHSACVQLYFCWASVNQLPPPFHAIPHLPPRHPYYIFSFYLSKTQLNWYSPWASPGLHEAKRFQRYSCTGKKITLRNKQGGDEEEAFLSFRCCAYTGIQFSTEFCAFSMCIVFENSDKSVLFSSRAVGSKKYKN